MTERATFRLKTGLAEMLKGGVIMDVTTAAQAKIAEDAGHPVANSYPQTRLAQMPGGLPE